MPAVLRFNMPYKNKADEKACRLRHRPKKLAYMKRYRAENLDREKQRTKDWLSIPENRARHNANCAAYAKKHPQVNRAAKKRHLAKKRLDPIWNAREAARAKAWRTAHPEQAKIVARRCYKKLSETDANFVIKNRLRARLTKKLKCQKAQKATNTMALTGCTGDFLRGYLESRFTKGMTWKNVHIDHHIPCAEFDLRDPEQQKRCFYYTNLKPMFGVDNMRKGRKMPAEHQAELI